MVLSSKGRRQSIRIVPERETDNGVHIYIGRGSEVCVCVCVCVYLLVNVIECVCVFWVCVLWKEERKGESVCVPKESVWKKNKEEEEEE